MNTDKDTRIQEQESIMRDGLVIPMPDHPTDIDGRWIRIGTEVELTEDVLTDASGQLYSEGARFVVTGFRETPRDSYGASERWLLSGLAVPAGFVSLEVFSKNVREVSAGIRADRANPVPGVTLPHGWVTHREDRVHIASTSDTASDDQSSRAVRANPSSGPQSVRSAHENEMIDLTISGLERRMNRAARIAAEADVRLSSAHAEQLHDILVTLRAETLPPVMTASMRSDVEHVLAETLERTAGAETSRVLVGLQERIMGIIRPGMFGVPEPTLQEEGAWRAEVAERDRAFDRDREAAILTAAAATLTAETSEPPVHDVERALLAFLRFGWRGVEHVPPETVDYLVGLGMLERMFGGEVQLTRAGAAHARVVEERQPEKDAPQTAASPKTRSWSNEEVRRVTEYVLSWGSSHRSPVRAGGLNRHLVGDLIQVGVLEGDPRGMVQFTEAGLEMARNARADRGVDLSFTRVDATSGVESVTVWLWSMRTTVAAVAGIRSTCCRPVHEEGDRFTDLGSVTMNGTPIVSDARWDPAWIEARRAEMGLDGTEVVNDGGLPTLDAEAARRYGSGWQCGPEVMREP